MPEPGAFVAVLSRQNPNEPLIVAARALASAGIPVFPCVPRGKRPMTEHGFRDATTSLDQVSAWWREQPAANIGMPTGWVSGVVVVDVDVHGPVNGFKAYNRAARAGLVSGWQVLVETPSGGMHAYFPTADAEQRCWQSATSGIDFRGDGGYVVVPPSIVAVDGTPKTYQVQATVTKGNNPVDSARLRAFLDPRHAPIQARRGPSRVAGRADVERLASWVAERAEGERNQGLFWASCRLAESGLPMNDALDVLTEAASRAGLDEREITTTVRSAYRAAAPRVDRQHRRDPPSFTGRNQVAQGTVAEPPSRVRGL